MKKSNINLIVNREDYHKYENYFIRLRYVLYVFGVIFFVYFLIMYQVIKSKIDTVNKLNLQKKTLLLYLNNKQTDEVKIGYIQKKYEDLNNYLIDDARSYPYFVLLDSAIKGSSESANLKSFSIGLNREVNFTVSYNNFSQLMESFKFIESDKFLKNFEDISLSSFTVIGASDIQKENYELSFNGRFIPLKSSLLEQ